MKKFLSGKEEKNKSVPLKIVDVNSRQKPEIRQPRDKKKVLRRINDQVEELNLPEQPQ